MADDTQDPLGAAMLSVGEALLSVLATQGALVERVQEALSTTQGERAVIDASQDDICTMLGEMGYAPEEDWSFEPNGRGVTLSLKLAGLLLLYLHENGMPERAELEALWPGYREAVFVEAMQRLGF